MNECPDFDTGPLKSLFCTPAHGKKLARSHDTQKKEDFQISFQTQTFDEISAFGNPDFGKKTSGRFTAKNKPENVLKWRRRKNFERSSLQQFSKIMT